LLLLLLVVVVVVVVGKKLSASEFDRNFVLFPFEHLVGLFVCLHSCSFVKEFCRVLLKFSLDQSPWGLLRVGLIELVGFVDGWFKNLRGCEEIVLKTCVYRLCERVSDRVSDSLRALHLHFTFFVVDEGGKLVAQLRKKEKKKEEEKKY